MQLRYFYTLILFLCTVNPALSVDAEWYVAVYGENFQLVDGASATPAVPAGVFLEQSFVGKVMYVRSQEYYELDQFRPNNPTDTSNSISTATESADASMVASESPSEVPQNTEFGPLVDTGLQYHLNGDFRGWYCANLYVLPMGERVYRLRCEEDMSHE